MGQVAGDNFHSTGGKTGRLVWSLALLLSLSPFNEPLKASAGLPAETPCHQQMPAAQQHGDACQHELGDAGCHCCQWHASASIVIEHRVSLSLALLVSIEPPHFSAGFPAPPQTPLYRPPIQTAS